LLGVYFTGTRKVVGQASELDRKRHSAPDPRRKDARSEPTRRVALKEAFAQRSVGDVSADDIEHYLRRRFQARVRLKTAAGVIQKDRLKPATVHQELRVLRRMMNVLPLTDLAVDAFREQIRIVTQLLRQGDAKVFKKYSQMKLQMKREALQKLNRKANESQAGFDTEKVN
jgi:hypothetical protein